MQWINVMEPAYPSIIKQILAEYSQIKSANGEIEQEVIFDDTGKHYQLLQIGWIEGKKRVFRPVLGFHSPNMRKYTEYAVE